MHPARFAAVMLFHALPLIARRRHGIGRSALTRGERVVGHAAVALRFLNVNHAVEQVAPGHFPAMPDVEDEAVEHLVDAVAPRIALREHLLGHIAKG